MRFVPSSSIQHGCKNNDSLTSCDSINDYNKHNVSRASSGTAKGSWEEDIIWASESESDHRCYTLQPSCVHWVCSMLH